MQRQKSGVLAWLMDGVMHVFLRAVAVVLMAWSGLSVHEVFGVMGEGGLWDIGNIAATVAMVAAGFLVLRALIHRMKDKRPTGPLTVLAVLYILFEAFCVLYHLSGVVVESSAMRALHGFLSSVLPFAVMLVTVFGIALAFAEVEQMREKGVLPQQVALPKNSLKNPNPANYPGNGSSAGHGLSPADFSKMKTTQWTNTQQGGAQKPQSQQSMVMNGQTR